MLQNKTLLLSLLGILLVIKFVVQPVLEWQTAQSEQLARQSNQLEKGLALLDEQAELETRLLSLSNRRTALNGQLYGSDSDATNYQLRVQRLLEDLLEKNNLRARNSNWLSPVSDSVSEELRLEIALSGKIKDFIHFLLDVEQVKPKLAVLRIGSAINRMSSVQNKLGSFNGVVVITGWRALSDEQMQEPDND